MQIPKLRSSTAAASALAGIWTLTLTAFIFATLYLARAILLPVALAALLTFVVAPLVTFLGRWLGRIGAVLVAATLILAVTVGAGWVLTRQLVDLASNLPDYKENIQKKLTAFKLPTGGRFSRFTRGVEELKNDLIGTETPAPSPVPGQTWTGTGTWTEGGAGAEGGNPFLPEPVPPRAPPAQASGPPVINPFQLARGILSPMVGPLGTAALVLLLVIIMLLKREDLRSRFIRLVGQGRISATTRAMDDAGARVTRYLLMQLILNVIYGTLISVGLYFIGVPNAVLWGASTAVLRFIPYVGPTIGAVMPVAVSLAVSPNWAMPLLTMGLFVVIELLSNNVLEPWLYGSSTGVSPMAVILAAVCWTWLWGPAGLVLATPITVCLVVLGRHIPSLSFLSVMLSDAEALTPAEDCYYRLLAVGEQQEMELVETYLRTHSLTELYDSMLIPVITRIEIDHRLDLLDDEQRAIVDQGLRDIVDDLDTPPPAPSAKGETEAAVPVPVPVPVPVRRVFCLPARADRDELAGTMLVQLLRKQGIEALIAPAKLGVSELIRLVKEARVDSVCISVVAPSTVLHARHLCIKLRTLLPGQHILVGLWGTTEGAPDATRRVLDSGANAVVTTLADALAALAMVPTAEVLPTVAGALPTGEREVTVA